MPSTATNRFSLIALPSPPEYAQSMPLMPAVERFFGFVIFSTAGSRFLKSSVIEKIPSMTTPSKPMRYFDAVIFAGHGEIKNTPISSGLKPVSFTAFSFAAIAASSTGVIIFKMFSKSSG